jgi:hypothetical protein
MNLKDITLGAVKPRQNNQFVPDCNADQSLRDLRR